jgi:hypothetical protein
METNAQRLLMNELFEENQQLKKDNEFIIRDNKRLMQEKFNAEKLLRGRKQ